VSRGGDTKLLADWLAVEDWFPGPTDVRSAEMHGRHVLDLRRAVRFEITNVAEYVRQWVVGRLEDGLTADDEDYLNGVIVAAPSYPTMWFEYSKQGIASVTKTKDAIKILVDFEKGGSNSKRGCLVKTLPCDKTDDTTSNAAKIRRWCEAEKIPLDDDSKWILFVTDWWRVGKEILLGPNYKMQYVIQSDGKVYWHRFLHWSRGEELSEDKSGELRGEMLPIFFAMTFMNCRNVVHEDVTPPEKFAKAHRKKHGSPMHAYRVLKVNVFDEVVKVDPKHRSTAGEPLSALHICRGHFRIYSEEKPLFGKYSGPVWVPAHFRGSESAGTVTTDFELET
jgi:hypothetical protein